MEINGYTLLSALKNENSGFSTWGFCRRGGQEYFIKEFINPVYPGGDPYLSEELKQRKMQTCRQFEEKLTALFSAVNRASNGNLVRIEDFFRHGSKYYVVTKKIPFAAKTPEEIAMLSDERKEFLIRLVLHTMMCMHGEGVVHGDIKATNLLVYFDTYHTMAKVIDFDGGFLADDPPKEGDEITGDMAYLAPEVLKCICGEFAPLSCKIDVFALGVLIHQYWTGQFPTYDTDQFDCIAEAILCGGEVCIDERIPEKISGIIRDMMQPEPWDRISMEEAFHRMLGDKPTDETADDAVGKSAHDTATDSTSGSDTKPVEDSTTRKRSVIITYSNSESTEPVASEEPVPEKVVSEEVVPEEVVLEEVAPEETVPEEVAPEEAVPEEVVPEEVAPEEVVPEEAVPEEVVSEEVVPEEVAPEEVVSEEVAPEEVVPEEAVPEEAVPEEVVSEEVAPEEAVPEEVVPEEVAPEEVVPEEAVPEEAVPEEAVSEEVVPEEVVSEEAVPEEAVPEEVVSEEVVPEEVVPEEVIPEEVVPEEADSEIVEHEEAEPVVDAAPAGESVTIVYSGLKFEEPAEEETVDAEAIKPETVEPEETTPEVVEPVESVPEEAEPEVVITEVVLDEVVELETVKVEVLEAETAPVEAVKAEPEAKPAPVVETVEREPAPSVFFGFHEPDPL